LRAQPGRFLSFSGLPLVEVLDDSLSGGGGPTSLLYPLFTEVCSRTFLFSPCCPGFHNKRVIRSLEELIICSCFSVAVGADAEHNGNWTRISVPSGPGRNAAHATALAYTDLVVPPAYCGDILRRFLAPEIWLVAVFHPFPLLLEAFLDTKLLPRRGTALWTSASLAWTCRCRLRQGQLPYKRSPCPSRSLLLPIQGHFSPPSHVSAGSGPSEGPASF